MKQINNSPKVFRDMFITQLKWTFMFLGIMLVIQVFKITKAIFQDTQVDTYFNAVFVAANIFIFILGIISIFFLQHYLENGVTRKDYFKGALLSSFGFAVLLPILSICISGLVSFIVKSVSDFSFRVPDINSVVQDIDGNIIGDIVTTIIVTPYVDPEVNLLLALAVFSLNIFVFYLLGWLISATFYRFNPTIGIGLILIALLALTVEGALLRISLHLPVLSRFTSWEALPPGIAIALVGLIILLVIWIIRMLTRNVTVKI